MNSIFKRTSIRQYKNQAVEEHKIDTILKAAMAAPSAGNQQPWEFYVVRDPAVIERLSATSPYAGCARKAPVAIVPCYRTHGLRYAAYAEIDLSACCENILLEAVEQDLGAVWLGIAPIQERMAAVEQILDMPSGLRAFAIIPVGYPEGAAVQPNRYDETRVHLVEMKR